MPFIENFSSCRGLNVLDALIHLVFTTTQETDKVFCFIGRETHAQRSNVIQRTWFLVVEQALGRLLRANLATVPYQSCAPFSQNGDWGMAAGGARGQPGRSLLVWAGPVSGKWA